MEVCFPSGNPKPHLVRTWGRSIEAQLTAADLTDVARHQLPAGRFDAPWPASALEAPSAPPPDGARYGDTMAYRKLMDRWVGIRRLRRAAWAQAS